MTIAYYIVLSIIIMMAVATFTLTIWFFKFVITLFVTYIGMLMGHLAKMIEQMDKMLSYAGDMEEGPGHIEGEEWDD